MSEERPPTSEDVKLALDAFAVAVRSHYGTRLRDIVLFGSRARGDGEADSDADVAVILADGDWRYWREKMVLAGIAYDPLIEFGLHIQPWPISLSEWNDPASHRNPRFLANIHRDARPIVVPP